MKMLRKQIKEYGKVNQLAAKSSAIYDIARLIGYDVISLDDLDEFSDDLKETVKFLIERW